MKKIIDISSVWAYTDEIWVIYLSSIIDVSWLGCALASMLTCHMVVSHLFESPRHFFFYLPGLPGCHSLTWIPGKVPERAIVTTSPIHCRPLCWCANRLASTLSIVLYEMNRSDFILKETLLTKKTRSMQLSFADTWEMVNRKISWQQKGWRDVKKGGHREQMPDSVIMWHGETSCIGNEWQCCARCSFGHTWQSMSVKINKI